jgi:hypothetical protein
LRECAIIIIIIINAVITVAAAAGVAAAVVVVVVIKYVNKVIVAPKVGLYIISTPDFHWNHPKEYSSIKHPELSDGKYIQLKISVMTHTCLKPRKLSIKAFHYNEGTRTFME